MNEMNCSVAGNSCLFMSDSQKNTAKLTIQTFVLSVYFTQLISVVSEKNKWVLIMKKIISAIVFSFVVCCGSCHCDCWYQTWRWFRTWCFECSFKCKTWHSFIDVFHVWFPWICYGSNWPWRHGIYYKLGVNDRSELIVR